MKYHVLVLLVGIALLGAGCGSRSTPAPEASSVQEQTEQATQADAQNSQQAAAQASSTEPALAAPAKPAVKQVAPKKTGTKPATVNVTILEGSFSPQAIAVQAGTTVVWTNKSSKNQTVHSQDSELYDSGNIAPGKTYKRVFEWPGSYLYYSASDNKLTGTIIVR